MDFIMPNCNLTWKARNQSGLNRIPDNAEILRFAETWIKKFKDTHEDNFAEKFIYLWVTVNAWASMCVPDITKNHEDAYLIHSMAADPIFAKRFIKLSADNKEFKNKVDKFISLAPVFQVLWLRNNHIAPWDMTESREEYVKQVRHQNPYHKGRDEQRYPAYTPACAFEHFDKDGHVPADWEHVIHMIYQVRCNLFHGGKSYDSQRDRCFIELAYFILWSMWKYELPDRYHGVAWRRLFVRSGFVFEEENGIFDFSRETRPNLDFLRGILKKMGLSEYLHDIVFSPPQKTGEEVLWIKAIEELHKGAEGGDPEDLGIMDTYVAGVIRWTNKIGIKTWNSCDGHGARSTSIEITSTDDKIVFNNCLNLLSKGKWRYEGRSLHNTATPSLRQIHYDRLWLFDLAEKLYKNMEILESYVMETRKTIKNMNT